MKKIVKVGAGVVSVAGLLLCGPPAAQAARVPNTQGMGIAAVAGPCSLGVVVPTTTEDDGKPGVFFWKLMQCLGRQGGYTGPIDGELGYNSWVGIQTRLKSLYFYSGPINGSPTTATWTGLQRYAGHYGTYTGPVDGVPGINTYKGLAYALNDRIAGRHP